LPEIKESIANENSNNNADDYIKAFGTPVKTKKAKINRFSWQVYTTPSVSYRRLEDDFPSFYTGNNTNVNGAVKHKPALGYEFGFGIAYNLTKISVLKQGYSLISDNTILMLLKVGDWQLLHLFRITI